jgi:nucleoside-diphosphate-sugar epimerase
MKLFADIRRPIVITGARGWIGSALLAHIARAYGSGWSDQIRVFGQSAMQHRAPDGTELEMRALDTISSADVAGAIVIHLAYLTKEKVDILGERAFTETNINIDDQLLRVLDDTRPHAVFIASSGAAALAERGIDRHPYGMCKLRQEDRFLAWSAKSGVPVLAGRIFNLAGPYINKIESYAIGSFILQAKAKGVINVGAQTPVFRSFLHADDLCALILGAAHSGIGYQTPIDLCGAEVLEMGDIAALTAALYPEHVTVSRAQLHTDVANAYLGNFVQTKCLALELGLDLAPFRSQLADTIAWLSEFSDAE